MIGTKSLPALSAKKSRELPRKIVITILMALLAFTMIVPFLWMLSASMKQELDVTKIPIQWIPKYFFPNNYLEVWNIGGNAKVDYHFSLAYFNSLKIAFCNVVGAVLTSCLAGYAFAKLKFNGRDVLFLLYLATMMIPSQITIIPKFAIFDKIGLMGTHWTLILPGIFTITGTFLMRQAFSQIPNEMRESAKIDGASEIYIWWRIMLPMVRTSMAALGMMVFLWAWNNYLDALVFLPNWKLYTIPLALTNFIEESSTQYGPMMAAASSALIPVFIVFIIGNKQFVKGLTAGAVKG